ncbi:hypothetical protein KW5_0122745, partial [Xanthomonas vasicola pv. vasculorum NCPPB 1326]
SSTNSHMSRLAKASGLYSSRSSSMSNRSQPRRWASRMLTICRQARSWQRRPPASASCETSIWIRCAAGLPLLRRSPVQNV